jgi:hypothetical protein
MADYTLKPEIREMRKNVRDFITSTRTKRSWSTRRTARQRR